jgi:hypothetical protein
MLLGQVKLLIILPNNSTRSGDLSGTSHRWYGVVISRRCCAVKLHQLQRNPIRVMQVDGFGAFVGTRGANDWSRYKVHA